MHVCTEDTANTYSFYRTRLKSRLKWHVWVLKEVFDITLKGGLRENSKQGERQDFNKPGNEIQ